MSGLILVGASPYYSLNPCCNGIYSMSPEEAKQLKTGLNPCCNGIYSMRNDGVQFGLPILCLNPCCNGIYSMRESRKGSAKKNLGLNPCCNGIYSMRVVHHHTLFYLVLILVVMEYTQ